MKTYRVKSIFGPTLQGEGLHAGMPCVFLRLSGCNAWDGRPETRAASACPYCDTDFLGGEALSLETILAQLSALVPAATAESDENNSRTKHHSANSNNSAANYSDGNISHSPPFHLGCVLTGGEPLLQSDSALLDALGRAFAWVDIETNGTRHCPSRPSNVFISCSPKRIANQPIVVEPDWWKILIPDQQIFLDNALASGKPVFVQPTCPDSGPHGALYQHHLDQVLALCYTRGCRLSLQQHKYLNIQ